MPQVNSSRMLKGGNILAMEVGKDVQVEEFLIKEAVK